MSEPALRVGISACFSHPDPQRSEFRNKTLNYIEASMPQWFAGHAIALMLPPTVDEVLLAGQLDIVDAVILHGGADVAPHNYGLEHADPRFLGDPIRDACELALLRACLARRTPVLGVCRGCQVINVGLGGTLIQDIPTSRPTAQVHRVWELYERLEHPIILVPETSLAALYGSSRQQRVNSVHHQAIDRLGKGLQVQAQAEDGIIEAVALVGDGVPYVRGVQWHPEFQTNSDTHLLPAAPLRDDLLGAARAQRALRLARGRSPVL